MFEKKTSHSREVLELIDKEFPDEVFDTIISRTVRFSESTVAGVPVTAYASSSTGSASYRRLARELIARGGAKWVAELVCREQMNYLEILQH